MRNLAAFALTVGGFKMAVSTIHGAGYIAEKATAGLIVGHAYCLAAYYGGAIDTAYQIGHNGNHLSVDIADSIGYGINAIADGIAHNIDNIDSFYISRAKGVENFLNNVYRWWQT